MEFNPLSLLGLVFLLLALFGAVRVRRDLARSETRFERALFGQGKPIHRAQMPLRFWCAVALNTIIVLLFALAAAAVFRASAVTLRRF